MDEKHVVMAFLESDGHIANSGHPGHSPEFPPQTGIRFCHAGSAVATAAGVDYGVPVRVKALPPRNDR